MPTAVLIGEDSMTTAVIFVDRRRSGQSISPSALYSTDNEAALSSQPDLWHRYVRNQLAIN
jgi:hypothetical protein